MDPKTLSKVIDFIKSIQQVLPDGTFSKALKQILENVEPIINDFPILSNDKEIEDFIYEFELNTFQNITKFLVELYFENFEAVHDSINDLKEIDLINTISKVKGAKATYEMARSINDEQRRNQCISNAQSILNVACSQLKDKILFYIDKQRKIDNMSKFIRIIRSNTLIKEADNNNNITKQAISILIAAVTLHAVIAHYTGDDIQLAVIKPFDEFKNKLLANDNCKLMNAYDADYKDGFWLNLNETMKTVDKASLLTLEMSDSSNIGDNSL